MANVLKQINSAALWAYEACARDCN